MAVRIQPFLAAFGCVVGGGLFVEAQPLPTLAPIFVQIAEIKRDFDLIPVSAREIKGEQVAFLTFLFQGKSETEVDSMVEQGVRSNRLVRIMSGTNLIAECKIAGGARFEKSDGATLHGLILTFDLLVDAESAANMMREDWDSYFRRRLDDKKSWFDNGSPRVPVFQVPLRFNWR